MKKVRTPLETWKTLWPVLNKRYKQTKSFLNYRTPWELLVAVIMSAQTTDEGVNRITPGLFEKFPTVADMAKAPVTQIAKVIYGVSYNNVKAKYLKVSAQILIKQFGGNVPDNETDLRSLPGVGRKTAVVVLSNIYHHNIGLAVDTHVIRFAHRFGLSDENDASKIEQDLLKIVPKKDWMRAGYAIKEYGRKEGRARAYKPELDPLLAALWK